MCTGGLFPHQHLEFHDIIYSVIFLFRDHDYELTVKSKTFTHISLNTQFATEFFGSAPVLLVFLMRTQNPAIIRYLFSYSQQRICRALFLFHPLSWRSKPAARSSKIWQDHRNQILKWSIRSHSVHHQFGPDEDCSLQQSAELCRVCFLLPYLNAPILSQLKALPLSTLLGFFIEDENTKSLSTQSVNTRTKGR